MASATELNEPSLLERLISSRNRDLSLFLPIILGLTSTRLDSSSDPDQESPDTPTTRESRGRIIFINPLTQGMVVIEGSSSRLDSLLRDLLSNGGQPPASKASIEAMPSVEISGEDEGGECVICLEDWEIGEVVKEMPCKHRFHGGCIEKWLGIHGSCPVCRFKMPVDHEDVINKSVGDGESDGDERERRRREIWVNFSFNRGRNGESNQTPTTDSTDSSSSPPPGSDHPMEG